MTSGFEIPGDVPGNVRPLATRETPGDETPGDEIPGDVWTPGDDETPGDVWTSGDEVASGKWKCNLDLGSN